MSVFNNYAKYYDLLYKEKDYQSEVVYVSELLKKYSKTAGNNLLNAGCGTGKHDRFFNESGFKIDAFDMSGEMISEAKANNSEEITFFKSTVKEFNSKKKYDAFVSLFHVLSYQTKNEDVNALFRIAKNNLKPGGVFIFDFWYGPAVLTDKPEKRVKEINSEDFRIIRTATPELRENENIVVVNYDLDILLPNGSFLENIRESHLMRYFFIPELELFAENNSCEILDYYNWMTLTKPDIKSWNVCLVGTIKK